MTEPVRRRVAIGVVDQGLSSLQNIALLFLTARAVSARDFGAFTLAYAVAVLGIGAGQVLLSEPYLLTFSTSPRVEQERVAAQVRGLVLLGVVPVGLLVAGVGLLASGPLRGCLLALAVSLPGLLLLDTARLCAITQKRPVRLLSLDLAWTALWLTVTLAVHPRSAPAFLLLWGLSATAVALVVAAPLVVGPGGLRGSRALWRERLRPSAGSLAGEYLSLTASGQITLVVVTALLGYAATGGIRGAQALLGPTATLFNALRIAVVPEIIRFGGSRTPRGRRATRLASGAAAAVAVGLSAVLLLLPDSAGRALLGRTWAETSVVLLPLCVGRIAFALETRALTALRADGRLRELARARTVSVLLADIATVVAAVTRSVHVTVWAIAAGIVAQLVVYEWLERRPPLAARRPPSVDVADGSPQST